MRGHFTYHMHVTDRRGSALPSVLHVTRTGWQGLTHRTSQGVFTVELGDFHVDAGTPLEQAIACAEVALSALIELREAQTPEAYDHP